MVEIMVTPHTCPVCKNACDVCIPTEDNDNRAPKPGDVTICGHCHTVMEFNPDMTVKVVGTDDIKDWPEDFKEIVSRNMLRLIKEGIPWEK